MVFSFLVHKFYLPTSTITLAKEIIRGKHRIFFNFIFPFTNSGIY